MAHFNNVNLGRLFYRAILASALLLSLTSCAVTYQFDPIEAWVVDAETGKPIEGAVVTANWELVKGSLDGPRYFGQLEVKETVTDKNGRFYFDGFSKEDTSGAELRDSDPQIIVFKAGYEFQRFVNTYQDGGAGLKKLRRTAAVNGKTVRLEKLVLYPKSIDGAYFGLNSRLERLIDDCHWRKIPNAIAMMDKEDRRLRALNISTSLIAMHHAESLEKKCGSIQSATFKVTK
jgi:hypothetical protein